MNDNSHTPHQGSSSNQQQQGYRPIPLRVEDLFITFLFCLLAMFGLGILLGGVYLGISGKADSFSVHDPDASDVEAIKMMSYIIFLSLPLGVLGVFRFYVIHLKGTTWSQLGLWRLTQGQTLYLLKESLLVTLGAIAVAIVAGTIIKFLFQTDGTNPQFEVFKPFEDPTLVEYFIIYGIICGLVPFAEELFFRGLFYTWIRERYGFYLAWISTSFAFALVHFVAQAFVALLLVGLILGYYYEVRRSLWAPIFVHSFFNAFGLSAYFFFMPAASG